MDAPVELICLTSISLFIFLELGDGRWNLSEVMICSIDVLVHTLKCLQKTSAFSFQSGLVPQDAGLSIIERFDFTNSRFCQSFEFIPLLDGLILLETIGQLFLSLVELCTMALDEGCRS